MKNRYSGPLLRRLLLRAVQILLPLSVSLGCLATANDWPRWRGPSDSGSLEGDGYPVRWTQESVAWKVPLPGKGCSTPVVWDGRIFLTAPTNGLDTVLAFDREGRGLWQTSFGPENAGKHRNGSGSNASPATDGSMLAVLFKSGTLAALEPGGRVRWQTDLVKRYGEVELFWDQGTSPVLTKDAVIVARMHGGDSWLAAFDKATGDLQWKVARNYDTPVEGNNAYTTPLVADQDGKETVLVWGAEHVTAHSTEDGAVRWSCGAFNPGRQSFWPAVASPVLVGEVLVVPTGRNDRNQPRLHGIRVGGRGDVTETHRLWLSEETGTFVPTPAAYRGKVYLLRDRGQVDCVEPASGRVLWQGELPRHRSSYYASPTIAGGLLYAVREDGVVFVARVEDGFELLAENDLGERAIASPVPLDGRLLLRGEEHLFCIAGPAGGS
ncbi:MAG: PQQ-binding-like beta-propeller repeat protein [Verrucomicrobiales bacterium]|nr:PQQ-binding-like beta-propeller repeat protein [Verrucomicrobiales bacterium]MCP5525589.1 PQQ-binding-like beta-propeller repeat protein [Verrucomicrobiales bacterium]